MAANNPPPDHPPRLNTTIPMWGMVITLVAALSAYFGQLQATNVAMAVVISELTALKSSVSRMETGRYTAQDSARDLAWRDERQVELSKRVSELELIERRKR